MFSRGAGARCVLVLGLFLAPGQAPAQDSGASGDLYIRKVTDSAPVSPGDPVAYEIAAGNAGPGDAIGVVVSDNLPAEVTGVTWACSSSGGATCPNSGGTGDIAETVGLPAGGRLMYTVNGTVDAGAVGSISNTARLDVPAGFTDTNDADGVAGSESDTSTDRFSADGDLSVTKETITTINAGDRAGYAILVTNSGSTDAVGVTVTDILADAFDSDIWGCTAAGAGSACPAATGSGDLNETIDVGAGGAVEFVISVAVKEFATGSVANTVTITPPAGFTDATTGNNAATTHDDIRTWSDLAITKRTTGRVVPGRTVHYEIVVTNNGPSGVTGARIQDDLAPVFSNVAWSCSASGGAECTASGTGDLDDTAPFIAAGGKLTYEIEADLNLEALGTVDNTASIVAPPEVVERVPGDETAQVSDAILPPADVELTMQSDSQSYFVGDPIQYTITVTNTGPNAMTGAAVQDDFPGELSDVSWTCSAEGGAACTAGPVGGDIDDTVDLPVGGRLTYRVTATLPDDPMTLTNFARVGETATVGDPDLSDNFAQVSVTAKVPFIPTLTGAGLALLAGLAALLGLVLTRREASGVRDA